MAFSDWLEKQDRKTKFLVSFTLVFVSTIVGWNVGEALFWVGWSVGQVFLFVEMTCTILMIFVIYLILKWK